MKDHRDGANAQPCQSPLLILTHLEGVCRDRVVGYLRMHTRDEINVTGLEISAARLIPEGRNINCVESRGAVETNRDTSMAALRLGAGFAPETLASMPRVLEQCASPSRLHGQYYQTEATGQEPA